MLFQTLRVIWVKMKEQVPIYICPETLRFPSVVLTLQKGHHSFSDIFNIKHFKQAVTLSKMYKIKF